MIKLSLKGLRLARRAVEAQKPLQQDKNLLDIKREEAAAEAGLGEPAVTDENARFILDSIGTFLNRSDTMYASVWDGDDIEFLTKVQDHVRRGLEQAP